MKQISIRVNIKDWKYLKKIFPAQRGESLSHYLERYVQALKEQEMKGGVK